MELQTQKQMADLELSISNSNNGANVSKTFSVTPNNAQKIIAQARLSNDFLGKINVVLVKNQSGEAIRLNATGMIAGNTNTEENDRTPRSAHELGGTPYHCLQINFDTLIKYQTLDAWAHEPKFKKLIRSQTAKQINTNMIQIGFFGEKRSPDTDPIANPKGQDIAKGWLTKLKEQNEANFISEGTIADNEIRIGKGGDYLNLDVGVNDIKQLIDDEFEDDGDLVAIIGSELLANEKAKFYEANGNTPSEKAKIEDKQVIGTYGGLSAFKIPHFPKRGIMVTSFNNISIYIQKDSIRRRMEDNPKRDRYETYQSQDMDFVIEELGKCAALDFKNVKLLQADGSWA